MRKIEIGDIIQLIGYSGKIEKEYTILSINIKGDIRLKMKNHKPLWYKKFTVKTLEDNGWIVRFKTYTKSPLGKILYNVQK